MAAPNRLGTTPSFRSSQKSLSTCFSSQTPFSTNIPHSRTHTESSQTLLRMTVGTQHLQPRADLLLSPFHIARNSLEPPSGFVRFPCHFQVN